MIDLITYALLRKQISEAAVQADWNQNDETAANYIKGRPCYETDPKMEYLVKDETVTLETVEGAPVDWAFAELATNISLEVGKTYTVTWDGKEYSVVGTTFEQLVIIGNMLVAGGDDTGEPFLIAFVGGGFLVYGLGAVTHTFSVSTMTRQIIPLPAKYLPTIQAEKVSGLASVATSGNYNDLTDTPIIPTDIVRYATSQDLTNAQKTRARTNIGAGTSSFSGSYNDLTNIIVGETYTYQSVTINNIKISSYTAIPENVKFEQIIYQTTWKVKWSSSTSTFSLELNKVSRAKNYYEYSNSSNHSYRLQVYDNGKIRCTAPAGVSYVNVTFNSIAVSTVIQLNEKYIPDTIQRVANMPTDHITYTVQALTEGQQKQARTNIGAGTSNFSGSYNDLTEAPIIDTTLTAEGAIADAKAVGNAVTKLIEQKADKSELEKLNTPKDYITLIDQVNGYHYIACMRDGNFVTYCATKSIEITAMPTKIEYTAGEYFDPTGMVITATAYDGTMKEITDFIYPSLYILDDDTFIEIKYIEAGITHIATVPITVTPFDPAVVLVDFEYTANDDGTYTITGWKGTYNGEASTEIIIPNNGLIRV